MSEPLTFRQLSLDARSHFYGYDSFDEIGSLDLSNWLESDERISAGGEAKFPRADFSALEWRTTHEHDLIFSELVSRSVGGVDFSAIRYVRDIERHV